VSAETAANMILPRRSVYDFVRDGIIKQLMCPSPICWRCRQLPLSLPSFFIPELRRVLSFVSIKWQRRGETTCGEMFLNTVVLRQVY
jgi:hypothetical protein